MPIETTNKRCCLPNVEHHPELVTEAVFAVPEDALVETPAPVEPVFGILATTLGGPSPGNTTKAWNAATEDRNALVRAVDAKIKEHVLAQQRPTLASSQKELMEELEERAWKEKEAQMREYNTSAKRAMTENELANARMKAQVAAAKRVDDLNAAAYLPKLGQAIGAALAVGTKHDGGKPPVSLVPQALIYGSARAFGFGAKKYARFNYRLGIKASRLLDAAIRHLSEVAEGKTVDEESGLHPLDHAAAALGMLMDTLDRVKQGKIDASFNDLYVEPTAKYARPLEIG